MVSSSLVTVFIIILLLLADFYGALIVFLMVGCTVLCQVGLIFLWNENLNSINMTNTIIAIGISVDYSIHITHAYQRSKGSSTSRSIKALDTAGVAVFNGGVSTLLAVSPICTATAYIFRNFFKC